MSFYILLSSLAGVHGAGAQANYAVGCAFQDAFARHRHSSRLNCTSLDLGIVSDVGYITERTDVAQNITLLYTGHDIVSESELLFLMDHICRSPSPRSSSPYNTQVLARVTTPAQVKRSGLLEEHAWMQKPLFRHLYQIDKEPKGEVQQHGVRTDYGKLIREATSLAQAGEIATAGLTKRLSRSLSVPEEDVDEHKPAHAFGVDSQVAVELQFWFSNEMRADLTVLLILDGNTIWELGLPAAGKSEHFSRKDRQNSAGAHRCVCNPGYLRVSFKHSAREYYLF
ncbi:hypothetical protein BDV95DRAFT_603218 [Massariosphaeria phaeospora]|uniref:Polyketide synthase-like phosphopantetheine-binding domain-containing protein n=1 Tax=Massariosphaeria phaeospora TaxID=100035 RepID=A0A7C8IFV4_9PLEO|nr:hypothetical protein BDV95DRAFT_603218 [Massariosphaeria phaeospora]